MPDVLAGFPAAPFRLRTYNEPALPDAGLPPGVAYFVFLIVGLATGFGLTIVWIGIPLLALVFAGSWAFAAFERQMAIHLLGAEVAPMIPLTAGAGRRGTDRLAAGRRLLRQPGHLEGDGLSAPQVPARPGELRRGGDDAGDLLGLPARSVRLDVGRARHRRRGLAFQVDSIGGVWACALLGLGLLFLSLNLLNALALVWRGTATLLLGSGSDRSAAAPPAIPDAIAA